MPTHMLHMLLLIPHMPIMLFLMPTTHTDTTTLVPMLDTHTPHQLLLQLQLLRPLQLLLPQLLQWLLLQLQLSRL